MENVGATAADIAAIGITNQRETTIVWDKDTGEPVHLSLIHIQMCIRDRGNGVFITVQT